MTKKLKKISGRWTRLTASDTEIVAANIQTVNECETKGEMVELLRRVTKSTLVAMDDRNEDFLALELYERLDMTWPKDAMIENYVVGVMKVKRLKEFEAEQARLSAALRAAEAEKIQSVLEDVRAGKKLAYHWYNSEEFVQIAEAGNIELPIGEGIVAIRDAVIKSGLMEGLESEEACKVSQGADEAQGEDGANSDMCGDNLHSGGSIPEDETKGEIAMIKTAEELTVSLEGVTERSEIEAMAVKTRAEQTAEEIKVAETVGGITESLMMSKDDAGMLMKYADIRATMKVIQDGIEIFKRIIKKAREQGFDGGELVHGIEVAKAECRKLFYDGLRLERKLLDKMTAVEILRACREYQTKCDESRRRRMRK